MRELIGDNLGLKVFSLVLAVLLELYFYIPGNSITATLTADVEIKNVPASMMIVWPLAAERGLFAKLKIRGPAPLVEQAVSSSHHLEIELPTPAPQTYIAYLNPRELNLPAHVEAYDIEPASIELKLDKTVSKDVVVVSNTIGEPAEGYRVAEIKAIPETIKARGPFNELDGLSVVETQKIDISNLSASKEFEVQLMEKGHLTTLSNDTVVVQVKVNAIKTEQSFDRVNIKVIAPDGCAATVDPSSVKVVISGEANQLKKILGAELNLIVDGTQLKTGKHEVVPSLDLPEGMEIIKLEPGKVILNLVTKQGVHG